MRTMNRTRAACAILVTTLLAPGGADAHFQLLYTPEVNIGKAMALEFKLVFTHPFENGHAMDMGQPEAFFVVHRGERADLLPTLRPMAWTSGTHNKAAAFEATVEVKRNGDYAFVLVPAPYLEPSEDIYIQQITKSFVNKGGIPSGWNEPLGLAIEIVPLNKPTNLIAGSTFSGRVLREGQPVPGAGIEIEYMSAEPDMARNQPGTVRSSPMPGGAVVAIADGEGVFTFGLPRAGFWGFAALGAGPVTEYQGKKLSQDAVLWVRAHDMR